MLVSNADVPWTVISPQAEPPCGRKVSTEPTEELLAQSAATCREGADEVNEPTL